MTDAQDPAPAVPYRHPPESDLPIVQTQKGGRPEKEDYGAHAQRGN